MVLCILKPQKLEMKSKHISDLLQHEFELKYADTLFPLEWSNLVHGRCPKCSCKLYQTDPINYGVWICKSVKCTPTFVIKHETYQQLRKELSTQIVEKEKQSLVE